MNDYDLEEIEQLINESAANGDWLPPDVYLTIIRRLIEEIRRYEYA